MCCIQNSLVVLLDLLEVYKNASGLTINCTKTQGMWIGSLRNNKTKPLGFKWPDEPVGVYYSYDEKCVRYSSQFQETGAYILTFYMLHTLPY